MRSAYLAFSPFSPFSSALLRPAMALFAASSFVVGCGSPANPSDGFGPVDAGYDGAVSDGSSGSVEASSNVEGGSSLACIAGQDAGGLGPSCCMAGNARCVPPSAVPASIASDFSSCTESGGGGAGLCVPDKIIASGSSFSPASCASIGSAPGVCLSKCIGAVSSNPSVSLLTQGTCDSDELCVPCTNPLTAESTGACDIHGEPCGADAAAPPADSGSGMVVDSGHVDAGSACPYTGPPLIDPSTLPACTPSCGGAHCLPTAFVPVAERSQLAACGTGSSAGFCTPDTLIESGGNGVPPTCVSVAGAEGRCLSTCLPSVQAESDVLPQSTCAAGTLCAPCFNPTATDPTAPTGACSVACDAPKDPPTLLKCPYSGPPVIDPSTFPACAPACGGAHCVPSALVPTAEQSELAMCPGGFCTPDTLTESGGEAVPPSCTSIAGAEGRCLSPCLPAIAAEADVLPQSTCAEGLLCAPCFNPTAADPSTPTGACSIACDKPKDSPTVLTCPYSGPPVIDPTVFPACAPACGGAHCVPSALVPTAEQSQLAMCPGGFCTPDTLSASGGEAVPPSCTSIAGAEGRCLSPCLPAIAAEASLLPQSTCASGLLCAPCFNPTAADPSTPTGACSIACDKPKDPPTVLTCPYSGPPVIDPTVFPACAPACGGAHCVPSALVPTAEQADLATCPGGFCTPDTLSASGGEAVPPSCTSIAGAEGRCLSPCLPAIAAEASLLPQSTCATGLLCAPCFNPTAANPSAPTGACSIACDKPKDAPTVLTCPYTGPPVIDPTTFPACAPACAGAHCVPAALVPASEQAQLTACSGGFCTPDPIVSSDNHYVPPTCQPFADPASEGRCTSDCLPAVAAESSELTQATCSTGNLCAPCNDPFSGAATGACAVGCDAPTKSPFKFPTCCEFGGAAQGTCVPTTLVPSSEESELKQDVCPTNAADYLCVPNEYLPNPPIAVSTCHALLGAGTCISDCVNIPFSGIFAQRDCPANHKCVACVIAGATTPGCN